METFTVDLVAELRREHEGIDRTVGSLRTYLERHLAGEADPADGARFIDYFRRWAGDYHHAREEESLFPALVEATGVPAHRGPVAALTFDHREMAGLFDRLSVFLGAPVPEGSDGEARDLAVRWSHALWRHIDAENSVLLPEADVRLRKAHLSQVASRPPNEAEIAARDAGEALAERYPPLDDPSIVRGEGCVACDAYGERCRGLERELWSDSEWEEFPNRMG